jgi:hypothetical protein
MPWGKPGRREAPTDRLRQVWFNFRLGLLYTSADVTFGKPGDNNAHRDFWPIGAIPSTGSIMIDTRSSVPKPSRSNSAVTRAAVGSISSLPII